MPYVAFTCRTPGATVNFPGCGTGILPVNVGGVGCNAFAPVRFLPAGKASLRVIEYPRRLGTGETPVAHQITEAEQCHPPNALEAEARSAGAKELRIIGHAVINKGFLSPRIAQRFGFDFRQINAETVELLKVLD